MPVATLNEWYRYASAIREDKPRWSSAAACRDFETGLFYSTSEADQYSAQSICRQCPVQFECLRHAIVCDELYGVWGGRTERQRRSLDRRLRRTVSRHQLTQAGRALLERTVADAC